MSDARGPVRIALLGGFTVSIEGAAPPPWRLRKAKTIVKLLALGTGHRVHRDVLIEQLWPEADPAVGTNNFHQALHAARRVVGAENLVLQDEIVILGGGGGVAVDVDDFEAAAAIAASTGAPEDIRHALTLWSGELLPEDLYEDWAAPHRDRLSAVRNRLVGDLARALIAGGLPDQALELLEPVAVERPLDEDVHRSLLVALGRNRATLGRGGCLRAPTGRAGRVVRRRPRARDDRRLPPALRRWRPRSGDVSAQPAHVVDELRRSPSSTG